MLETSARLLRLLSLLQVRREWTGPDLARRLGVTTRTVRNDVNRLRDLGYPVHAARGVAGGYQLGAGAALPPLLLDDEEAVAVAVGLRTAASAAVTGIEETSLRALAKLERLLPGRLRHRVAAVQSGTAAVPMSGPTVDAEVLTTVAAACRDRERLRFDYRDHRGAATVRTVEPHRLVAWARRWYLVGWDVDKGDWRTFRADRITPRVPTGPRFEPRDPPDGDVVAYVTRTVGTASWHYRARIVVHAPAAVVRARIPFGIGQVEELDEHRCVLWAGSDNPHVLALYVGWLDVDFEVAEPPELVEAFRRLAARYSRAT
jgi:predicted DNA-binding transcriptional regulator YafY